MVTNGLRNGHVCVCVSDARARVFDLPFKVNDVTAKNWAHQQENGDTDFAGNFPHLVENPNEMVFPSKEFV